MILRDYQWHSLNFIQPKICYGSIEHIGVLNAKLWQVEEVNYGLLKRAATTIMTQLANKIFES